MRDLPSQSQYLINNCQPLERFQWKVLPQGMLNSPTICQHFVHQAVHLLQTQFPQSIIYHYMHDILFVAASQEELKQVYLCLEDSVSTAGLVIAPEKVQHYQPWQYLGYVLFHHTVRPQTVQIQIPDPLSLNSL